MQKTKGAKKEMNSGRWEVKVESGKRDSSRERGTPASAPFRFILNQNAPYDLVTISRKNEPDY